MIAFLSDFRLSCVPSQIQQKSVDVFLMRFGSAEIECAQASVEEHSSCVCGCAQGAEESCTQLQHFVPGECRCVCSEVNAQRECTHNGHYWDEALCQCLCRRRSEWEPCPPGYAFNPSPGECGCVALAEYASTVIEILIIILVTSSAMTGTFPKCLV